MKKICTKCEEGKELSEFYKAARMKDGYQSNCKVCQNTMSKISMDKNPDKYKDIRKRESDRLTKRFMDWKQNKGCACCEEDAPYCLELHHKDPAQKEIQANKLYKYKWETFMTEARKCILVCSNCHRKIHYGGLDDTDIPLIEN